MLANYSLSKTIKPGLAQWSWLSQPRLKLVLSMAQFTNEYRPIFNRWIRCNTMVLSWILNSISKLKMSFPVWLFTCRQLEMSGWIFKRGLHKGMQLESFRFRRQSHFLLKISPFWVLTLLGLKNFGMSYLITRPSLIIVFKNTLCIFQYCFQSNLDHFVVGITSKLSR